MSDNNGSIESAIQDELIQNPRSVDSSQQWAQSDEDYQKAKKIVAYLTSLGNATSLDQKKILASQQEFVKNYENSVRAIRKAIAEKSADAE